ncbi:hypothetical protein C9374_012421 [Naegleria lovaniensis]|uniref:Uncharacterized protein n=1 Tax=Naegleria lovaniensis TaxID=51637 RepID=A0AA88KQW3_NAELO|nr:uncharacterized protein C9374_012421 [Naegleria lovaniensis]KAG2392169.1 hypothetical protein C9374_012421 [Naegleria lovaniensis]
MSSSEQQISTPSPPKKSKQEEKLQKIRESRTLEFIRPHRCDIRLEEFYAGTWATFNPLVSFKLFSTYVKCLRSEVGQEPTTPLHYISDDAYNIYKKVYQDGRVRGKFFQNTETTMAKERIAQKQQQQTTLSTSATTRNNFENSSMTETNTPQNTSQTTITQQPTLTLPELQRLKKK